MTTCGNFIDKMKNTALALASNALTTTVNFYAAALVDTVTENERLHEELKALPVLASNHQTVLAKYQALKARTQVLRMALREMGGLSDAEVKARETMLGYLDGDDT